MNKLFLLVFLLVFTEISNAGTDVIPTPQLFEPENLSFDYLSTDGSFWYDCKHDKGVQPHSWTVYCDRFVFQLHLMLIAYPRENETTFEFHYWADEFENLHETHTQSTWITVDKNTKLKKLMGYLGFTQDSSQLRIEIHP